MKDDPYPQITPPSLKMMATGIKCSSRPTITPSQSCSANFYNASKEGWDAHFGDHITKGTWFLPESKLHIYYLEAVFLALKRVPSPLLKQDNTYSHREHHSSDLYKQGRRHEVMPTVPICREF